MPGSWYSAYLRISSILLGWNILKYGPMSTERDPPQDSAVISYILVHE